MNRPPLSELALRAATYAMLFGCLGPVECNAGQPAVPSNSGEMPMTIQVSSSAFGDGQKIPKKHTGEGQDLSPPLAWDVIPQGTKELALICDDPDAPTAEPWVHWVMYKIPPETRMLAEGVPQTQQLKEPPVALQGENSWPKTDKNIGYRGPMPPKGHGVHHYHFRVYALDVPISLAAGATKTMLLAAVKGHVLASGELVGTYERR